AMLAAVHPVGLPPLPRPRILRAALRPVPVHVQRLRDDRHHQRQDVDLRAADQPPVLLLRTPRHVHRYLAARHIVGDPLETVLLALPQTQQPPRHIRGLSLRKSHQQHPLVKIRKADSAATWPTGSCTRPTPAAADAPSARRSRTPPHRSSAATAATPCRPRPRTGSGVGGRWRHAGPWPTSRSA